MDGLFFNDLGLPLFWYSYKLVNITPINYSYIYEYVPHKAVAEVSKIGNL